MKKLLFMVAAVLVMVSCGSKEKTPEQRASEFANELVGGIVNEDCDKIEAVITNLENYVQGLDESLREMFVQVFCDRYDALIEELNTTEQKDKMQKFVFKNLSVFEPFLKLRYYYGY